MHIWTLNILEMVIIRVESTIAIKQQVIYGLSVGIFTFELDHFKGQDRAYFTSEYFENGDM